MEIYVNNKQSLNDIINNANPGDKIILDDGVYFEKIEIWKENLIIKSKNKHKAIITNNDYYHKIMPNHNECNTFNTFTMLVGSNNVTLEDLMIKNLSVPSKKYGQAVALHVLGDDFKCVNCIIESAQDTLFTGPLPLDLCERYKGFYDKKRLLGIPSHQQYLKCKIIGDVDFIFGCATALFEECDIVSLFSEKSNAFICAPAHPKGLQYGYLFYKCNIISDETKPYSYLCRPWRDYGQAAFIDCNMGAHILPQGYDKWQNTNRDKTAIFYEYTKNVDLSKREPWVKILSEENAIKYVNNFKKYIAKIKKTG